MSGVPVPGLVPGLSEGAVSGPSEGAPAPSGSDQLGPGGARGAREPSHDELDPELLQLPAPPRRERTLTLAVLAMAAAAALAMAFVLRRDVAYALAGGQAGVTLGDLATARAEGLASAENRLVRAEGLLGAAGGIRYERPFVEDSFRTVPVAGRNDIWVDVRVPAGQENGRWEPPRTFVGRLVRMSAAGPRHRGLATAIEAATHERVPAGAWLLVDGEDPDGARWAVVLAALFLGFALWNAVAIARIVRKVA